MTDLQLNSTTLQQIAECGQLGLEMGVTISQINIQRD